MKCAVGGCGGTPDAVLPGGVADISQLKIATDGVRVYFNGSGRVLACPVGGCAGAPTVIFGGLQYPGAIAVGATKVVVIDEGTNRIWAIPK